MRSLAALVLGLGFITSACGRPAVRPMAARYPGESGADVRSSDDGAGHRPRLETALPTAMELPDDGEPEQDDPGEDDVDRGDSTDVGDGGDDSGYGGGGGDDEADLDGDAGGDLLDEPDDSAGDDEDWGDDLDDEGLEPSRDHSAW